MNVIFLDIDGVLNTVRFQKIQIKNHECSSYDAQFNFDPICMKNLKTLVEMFDCKIVISSTWRVHENSQADRYWTELMLNLKMYGLDTCVIGVTPPSISDEQRGDEIQKWLDSNSSVDNFVILDDDSDMAHLIDKLAQCSFENGFTKDVLEKAIAILAN